MGRWSDGGFIDAILSKGCRYSCIGEFTELFVVSNRAVISLSTIQISTINASNQDEAAESKRLLNKTEEDRGTVEHAATAANDIARDGELYEARFAY